MKPVPVKTAALLARINRELAKKNQRLCKSRSANEKSNLGAFYLLDTYHNIIVDSRVNVAEFAKKIGAMKAWETWQPDEKGGKS